MVSKYNLLFVLWMVSIENEIIVQFLLNMTIARMRSFQATNKKIIRHDCWIPLEYDKQWCVDEVWLYCRLMFMKL